MDSLATRWSRRFFAAQLIGLLAAAMAVGARWARGEITPATVPPGLVILLVAAAVLTVFRRVPAVLLGIVAAAYLVTRQTSPAMSGTGSLTWWIGLSGLALAGLAGIGGLVAIGVGRRHGGGRQIAWGRGAQVIGLLLLAPICAEYLAAHDDSTGDPLQLMANLFIFVPLYGCAALLIREVARRARLGWPGIVLLAVAVGLLQAGVIDQSLFSVDYRQIDGWDEAFRATLIAPLGLSAVNLANFVGGHVIFSLCGPIALIEAARPQSATTPWLGWRGLVLTAAAYAGALVVVLTFHLRTEESHASPAQVIVSLVVVLALVAAAVSWARRRPPNRSSRPAPRLWTTFGAALVASLVHAFAPETWLGVALIAAVFAVSVVTIAHVSRTTGWGVRHVAAIAAAPLLVRAVSAFTYYPLIGEVSASAKYAHNAVLLAVIVVVTGLALRRPTNAPESGRSCGVLAAESTS